MNATAMIDDAAERNSLNLKNRGFNTSRRKRKKNISDLSFFEWFGEYKTAEINRYFLRQLVLNQWLNESLENVTVPKHFTVH